MTKVTFENATIRDVIGKAARVAPTSGSAFDKAAGIMLEIDADRNEVTVRATNTEIFYMEITDPLEIEGPSVRWLLPSAVLDGVCNKLPIGSGKTVEFDDGGGNSIKVATGRMRATIRLMNSDYYPQWSAFNPTDLVAVPNFSQRIQQVQWAASKTGNPPLTGVNLNGTHVRATDQFRVAMTPCEMPSIVEPVTIPASIFNALMKHLGDVHVGMEAGTLLVMPDEATQIRASIYPEGFPKIEKVFLRDETHAVMVKKTILLEMIERTMVMGERDRTPLLKMILGLEELAVLMEDQEIGLLGDVVELAGQLNHDRHYIGFTPDNLSSALKSSPNEDMTIYYHYEKPMKPVRLDGGSGYEVLIMPRRLEKENEG